MSQAARPTTWAVAAVLAITLLATGCSGDEPTPKSAAPSSSSTPAPTAKPVATKVRLGVLTGRLPKSDRKRLTKQVQPIVDRWIDAAYVGGTYPRRSFKDSWPGFTQDARARAAHDKALTSNAAIGRDIDGVVVRRRAVTFDVLSVKRRPVGVTARVLVVFRTTGKKAQVVRVAGPVYLTRTNKHWRVFGYDIARDARKAKGGAA